MFSELNGVIKRPKLQKRLDKKDVDILLEIINKYAEQIELISEVDICRDKKDNYLLALAKDSQADYLITGDTDLLIIEKFEGTKIIKIADYRKLV